MIPIQKKAAPPELAVLQQDAAAKGLSPAEAYATLRGQVKKRVRNQLQDEQGGLCAYCMCKIPRKDTPPAVKPIVIEHMIARNPADGSDVGQGLDYHNLVAVCHGNRGPHGTRRKSDLICDAHRGNVPFRKINPLDAGTLSSIFYLLDGSIDAEDADVKFDLTDTLNLNCTSAPQLSERKAALDALTDALKNVPLDDLPDYCTTVLQSFLAETNPKTPYAGIVIWYLRHILNGLNSA